MTKEEKKLTVKINFVGFEWLEEYALLAFWVVLLSVAIAIGAHSAYGLVNLDHGETFSFNYINVTNVTELIESNVSFISDQEDFFCAVANPPPPASQICNVTTYNLELEPGETDARLTDPFCQVTAHCSPAEQESNSKCVFHKTLVAGQEIEKEDAACDISIRVRTANETFNEDFCSQETYTSKVPILIDSTTEGDIRVQVGSEKFDIDPSLEIFSGEGELEIQCPEDRIIDTDVEAEQLLDICSDFTPFLVNDWIKPTLEACRNEAKTHLETAKNCDSEKSGLRDTIGRQEGEVKELGAKLTAQIAVSENLRKERNDVINKASNRLTISWVLFIYSIIVTVILGVVAFAAWRMTSDTGFAGIFGGGPQ